jgi:hypothetical protein
MTHTIDELKRQNQELARQILKNALITGESDYTKALSGLLLERDVAALKGGEMASVNQAGFDVVVDRQRLQVKHRARTKSGKGTFVDLRNENRGGFDRMVVGYYTSDYTLPVITHDVAHDDVWASVRTSAKGRIQFMLS